MAFGPKGQRPLGPKALEGLELLNKRAKGVKISSWKLIGKKEIVCLIKAL
jgi:hypothetical protein